MDLQVARLPKGEIADGAMVLALSNVGSDDCFSIFPVSSFCRFPDLLRDYKRLSSSLGRILIGVDMFLGGILISSSGRMTHLTLFLGGSSILVPL